MKAASAIAAAVLVTGCGHIEGHSVMFTTPAAGAHDATLFVDKVPTRPYAEIGIVQGVAYGDEASPEHALQSLRAEGKRAGCDAIVSATVRTGATAAHAIGVCAAWTAEVAAPPSGQ